MVTKYSLVAWEFNQAGWSDAINQAIEAIGIEELAEMTGLSKSILNSWSKGRFNTGFPYPAMTSVLTVVNLLDIDVRLLFQLEDK